MVGIESLSALLPGADLLILTVPGTDETKHLVGAEQLDLLPDHAVLINVSRGFVIDEDALVDVLRSGGLRGAGLDVFAQEPLPGDSPLWDMDNVLITPHVSAVGRGFWERQVRLLERNIDRYKSGGPLLNVVDKKAGY